MHLEFELKSKEVKKKKGTIILRGILFAKRIRRVQYCVSTASSETRCSNEGLGQMNVLGKPTYLCTLKAQPG